MNNARVFAITALVVGALSVTFSPAGGATASTTDHGITTVIFGDDRFRNYDVNTSSTTTTNADWPVTVLFTNNASVDKAKSSMDAWTNLDTTNLSSKYLSMANSGTTLTTDSDAGKKPQLCGGTGVSTRHYRVYGLGSTGGGRLFNTTFGYWVPATTRVDVSACGSGSYFCCSEATEEYLTAQSAAHTAVVNDKFNIFNAEPYRDEAGHIWFNSGYASTIDLP